MCPYPSLPICPAGEIRASVPKGWFPPRLRAPIRVTNWPGLSRTVPALALKVLHPRKSLIPEKTGMASPRRANPCPQHGKALPFSVASD